MRRKAWDAGQRKPRQHGVGSSRNNEPFQPPLVASLDWEEYKAMTAEERKAYILGAIKQLESGEGEK